MGIGFSLIVAAAGAILIWAVHTTSSSFDYHTAGVILLVVGCIGFAVSLAFWSSWGGWYHRIPPPPPDQGNTTTVVDRR
jgi:hypothetical protein